MLNLYIIIFKSIFVAKLLNDIYINLSIMRRDYFFTIIILINKMLSYLRNLGLLKYLI